jgi:hypothetical protein
MLDLLPQLWKGHFSDWLLLKSGGVARLVSCQSIRYHWLVVLLCAAYIVCTQLCCVLRIWF